MSHFIRAFIGRNNTIKDLASNWRKEAILLPQDFAMLFLTDELFDDITELVNLENNLEYSAFERFTTAVANVMEHHSFQVLLAYIETDYFGGMGSQSGVLFFDGKIEIEPQRSEGIINRILQRAGVYKEVGKDEFDTICLGRYRHM